jgi:hypothetical protein
MPRTRLQPDRLTPSRYDTGTISGILAMPYWRNTFSTGFRNEDGELSVSPSQESLIVSILSAGTFFGAFTAALCGDFFGRRMGLVLSATFVFSLGVILQTTSSSQPTFIAGRFFAGYGVGLVSALGRTIPFLFQTFGSTHKDCSSSLPVRDGAEVDSRYHCRILSTRYYYLDAPRCHCQQWNQGPA